MEKMLQIMLPFFIIQVKALCLR